MPSGNRKTVSMQEMVVSNMLTINALVEFLGERGLLAKTDVLKRINTLWDSWKTPDGARLESCTILTTSPNSLVSDLHDRMPVILPRESYEKWLAVPAGEVSRLLVPFDGALMRRFEVSALVNSPKNDTADCVTPVRAKATLPSQ